MLLIMIVQLVNVPRMLLYYFIMAVCILPKIHGVRVVLGLPSQFMEGGLDAIVFGKWLLVVETPILVNGIILERGSRIELLSRLRMKKRTSFQTKMVAACAASGTIWMTVLTVGVMWFEGGKTALHMIFMMVFNIFMWETMQVMIYYCFKNAFWSGAAILLINGGSCLIGLYMKPVFQYMPAAWGMLCRSSLWLESADILIRYEYMIVASISVAVICAIITIKKEGDELCGGNPY